MSTTKVVTQFRTPFNHHLLPRDHEVNTQPSMTVPNETLSLRELLERYARGYPIEGERNPIYHGEEEEYPDLRTLDLSEIHDLKLKVEQDIKEQQENLMQQQAAETALENEKRQNDIIAKAIADHEAKKAGGEASKHIS